MNRLPGVCTFSSCGGHSDYKSRSRSALPAGKFNVNFDVEPTVAGWRSLDLLTWAVHNVEDFGRVRLRACRNGEPGSLHEPGEPALSFAIAGVRRADPDAVADLIDAAATQWAKGKKRPGRRPRNTRASR